MLAMGTIGYSLAVYGELCELCNKEHDGDCPKLLMEVISEMNYVGPADHRAATERALRIRHEKDKKIFLHLLDEYGGDKLLLYALAECNCETLQSKFGRVWKSNYEDYKAGDSTARSLVGFAETLLQTQEDCVWLECALITCAKKYGFVFKPGIPLFFKPLADKIIAEEFSKEKDPFEEGDDEDDDDEIDEETSHKAAITRLVHDMRMVHPESMYEDRFIDEVRFSLSVCAHRYGFPWGPNFDYVTRDRNFWSLVNTIQREIRNTNDAVWIYGVIATKHKQLRPTDRAKFDRLLEKDKRPLSLSEDIQATIHRGIEQTTVLQAEFILTMIGRMSGRLSFYFPKHNRLDIRRMNFEILNRIGELVQTQEDAIRIEEEGLRLYGEANRMAHYAPMLPPSYTQKRDWFRKYNPNIAPEILQDKARRHAAIIQAFCTIIRREATTYKRALTVQDVIIASAIRNYFPWRKKNDGEMEGGSWYMALLQAGEHIETLDDALAYDRAAHDAGVYFEYNYILQVPPQQEQRQPQQRQQAQ